jgi:hypothetical protein
VGSTDEILVGLLLVVAFLDHLSDDELENGIQQAHVKFLLSVKGFSFTAFSRYRALRP